MIVIFNDPYMMALLKERFNLQKELATILTRAGGSNPNRKEVNKRRAQQRGVLRRRIKFNAFHLAAHISEHHKDGSLPRTMCDVLHVYVYGDNASSVADNALEEILKDLNMRRNAP